MGLKWIRSLLIIFYDLEMIDGLVLDDNDEEPE